MFCEECKNLALGPTSFWDKIDENPGKDRFGVKHHESAIALQQCANDGCHLCRLAWAALTEQPNEFPQQDSITFWLWLDRSRDVITGDQRDEYRLDVHCGGMETKFKGELRCEVLSDKMPGYMTFHDDKSTDSEQSYGRIRIWKQLCGTGHPNCRPNAFTKPLLPTRVIEVGNDSSNTCRLVSGAGKNDEYACLSHCWGNRQPLTTTKATLALRQQCISDSELPQTFQDAVKICRKLGIRYLWIDSICIIQDSEEDWRTESATMSQVYSNSTLTIAAASATDSTIGCFASRDGLAIWPCVVTIFSRHCSVSRHPTMDEEVFGELEPMQKRPLDRRAWVLQEQVLAPRTLSFMDTGLYWKCAGLRASEKYPMGLSGVPQTAMDYRGQLQGIINGTGLYPDLLKARAYGFWYRSLMDFTTRDLKVERDKLPAISGLAKKFAESAKDFYVAGLWMNDICISLLWIANYDFPFKSSQPATRVSEYRAPTWSWASIDGLITYVHIIPSLDQPERITVEKLVRISEVELFPVNAENVFGEMSNAWLKVQARLLTVIPEGNAVYFVKNDEDREKLGRFWSDDTTWVEKPCYCMPLCLVHKSYSEVQHRSLHPLDPSDPLKPVKDSSDMWCLVLEQTTTSSDTFVRVGVCMVLQGQLGLVDYGIQEERELKLV